MSLGLAFKVFFAVLFRAEIADQVRRVLQASSTSRKAGKAIHGDESLQKGTTQQARASVPEKPSAHEPKRSEALTLLSTLQREARFLDLVHEPLETFDDAQIGAAARQVIRDSRTALDRMFGIEPLSSDEEGTPCSLPSELSVVRYRIVGKAIHRPTAGVVAHRGWRAARCQLPTWTGSQDEGLILAPIEVEID
jgi:hypothetical protein